MSGALPYRVWGLTGGIASGKSTAAKFFAEAGVAVIDADEVARALRAPGGAAHDAISKRFGTADAARLREIVFADADARRDLEAILHPLIIAESTRQMAELARARGGTPAKPTVIVYEAALLVETGRYKDFAGLIVVDSKPETRRQRLVTRDKLAPALATSIIAAQIPDEERRRAATIMISNEGTLDALRAAVAECARKL